MKRGSTTNRLLDRVLGIPFLRATSLFKRKNPIPASISRLGVLASPTIGDTLLTSAALQDIKRHYPHSHLTYFASAGSLAAVKLLPCVDEISFVKITDPFATIRTMRKRRLDMLFDFTPWQRLTAFYSAASAAKCRVGFRSTNQYRHYHYDVTADHSSEVHELENFRRLLKAVGISPVAEPRINFPEHLGFASAAEKVIVFHPWASGERAALRQWPALRWIDLASRLKGRNTVFLITGAPSEQSKSEELCQLLGARGLKAETFRSDDGLPALTAMLHSADLVVSVNTGILHLAAIAGAPTIALNGPTATHRWGPVGPRVASVEPSGGGGGFLHFGFEFSGNPTDTMQRIRAEDVHQAAITLMSLSVESRKAAAT